MAKEIDKLSDQQIRRWIKSGLPVAKSDGGPVPDSLLRPIRGYPLGADIALGITGLPARSIA